MLHNPSPARGLPIAWYIGCTTPEEKKEREDLIRNSVRFAEVFRSILAAKYALVEHKGLKEDDYKETGWMTLQAFRNGKLAELHELDSLFSFLKG